MLTLIHAPQSRSSRLITLMDEMAITDKVALQLVNIPRRDGTGARDPANPHPEGKAPALIWNGTVVTETPAVILALTEAFPDTPLAPKPGDPNRAAFLTWMVWYSAVMEPVLMLEFANITHPILARTFRGHAEVISRIETALAKGPYLLGDTFTAADLLIHSPFAWFSDATPDVPVIREWIARCQARPSVIRTNARDTEWMAAAA